MTCARNLIDQVSAHHFGTLGIKGAIEQGVTLQLFTLINGLSFRSQLRLRCIVFPTVTDGYLTLEQLCDREVLVDRASTKEVVNFAENLILQVVAFIVLLVIKLLIGQVVKNGLEHVLFLEESLKDRLASKATEQ